MKRPKDAEPAKYQLPHGETLTCTVCSHQLFERAAHKLNTTGMELMNLAWANKDATCLTCARCRHIHWFDA